MLFGRFWAESGLVATLILSPRMLPLSPPSQALLHQPAVSPRVCSSNTERKQHGTQPVLEHQLRKVHHKSDICLSFAPCCSFHLFLSLLIFVILSCRLFFLSSLSGFLPVAAYFGRLCDEHGTQHISKNKSRPFPGGVLVSNLSPPQTWNLNNH